MPAQSLWQAACQLIQNTASSTDVGNISTGLALFLLSAAGHPDSAYTTLLSLQWIDFGLLIVSSKQHARIFRRGFSKWLKRVGFGWLAVVLASHVDESFSRLPLMDYISLRDLFIAWFCGHAGWSSCNHLKHMGVNVPVHLVTAVREKIQKLFKA